MRRARPFPTQAIVVIAALALGACAGPPTRTEPPAAEAASGFPASDYAALESRGRVFHVDAAASRIDIHVFRAGALAAQGHNHVIRAGAIRGAVFLPDEGLDDARFDVELPLQSLDVDPPQARARLGGGFASELSAKARAATRENMLGDALLDAARFPTLRARSTTVGGALPRLALDIEVTLRGTTHGYAVPVAVVLDGDRLTASGALAVRHADFGLEPYSALGGLLRVADPITIDFELVAVAR